jgi:rRNA biogenesis protein RRP5
VQVFSKKGKHFLYPPEQLSDKNLRFCRVIKVHGNSLRVQTRENEFKNCHVCDITDLVTPFPLHEYQVGDYTIGRIVSDKEITLRKSLVLNGLPQTMKDVVQYYGEDEKRGDYRARIEAAGPAALKLETVAFGYIKTLSDKGCFISLSRNFDVRIERSEYSDHFLAHPEHLFTPNKLVLCRLINIKSKTGDTGKFQIDASLRESVVKFGYPLNDEILETGIGLTVHGIVTGYVKGKALVRLESSKFTGIIALKDVEEAQEDQTLEKVLPLGKRLTCKVVEYSREAERRLIRLSTLAKVFKKFDGLETTFDTNQRIVNLWNNFQDLSAI